MLEFFEDGLDDGPLILLYGGGREEVILLRNALRGLADRVGRRVAIDQLPFVQSVDNCRLSAVSVETDVGVAARMRGDFAWSLDQESWLQVDGLLEPFCVHEAGTFFQYLNTFRGPQVIYSTDRSW